MKMIFASLILATGFASLAQASVRCETRSAGRYFEETRAYESDARSAVIQSCTFSNSTNISECANRVICMATDGGLGFPRTGNGFPRTGGGLGFPRTGGNGQPTPSGDLCYVRQTSQWVDGSRFFSLAHDWANRNNTCVVAKIASVPYSGRIYDRDGRRVGTSSSGLSNSEVDSVLRSNGLYGCEQFSCTAL